jgi:hypothetical protein
MSQPDDVDKDADAQERLVFFDGLVVSYEVLRDDPDAWSEIEAERSAESAALRDCSS